MAGFISPLAGPGAWKTFDGKIAGAINCILELGSAISSEKVPASVAFNAAYEKKWGVPIEAGHGISPSYEAVYILAEAINRAGSVDADAIVAELEKTDRKGVLGRVKFDDGHQAIYDLDPNETATSAVFQWTKDGKRPIVFPPALSEKTIELPEGLKSAK